MIFYCSGMEKVYLAQYRMDRTNGLSVTTQSRVKKTKFVTVGMLVSPKENRKRIATTKSFFPKDFCIFQIEV